MKARFPFPLMILTLLVLCFPVCAALSEQLSVMAFAEPLSVTAPAEPGIVTGFACSGVELYTFADKPAPDELSAVFPRTLTVFLDGGTEPYCLPVSWYCVGADYEKSEYAYYQFSPRWDTEQYPLAGENSSSVDLSGNRSVSVPYIGIFIRDGVFSPQDANKTPTETSPVRDTDKSFFRNENIAFLQSVTGTEYEDAVYQYLTETLGFTTATACGIMANLVCESYGFNPMNLQGSYERSLGFTDESYTEAVDNGTYDNFIHDGAGYGICQWTYWSRKQGLLEYAHEKETSIGDLQTQLEYLRLDLSNRDLQTLRAFGNSADDAYEAASWFCLNFEKPYRKEEAAVVRGNLARDTYWKEYGPEEPDPSVTPEISTTPAPEVSVTPDPFTTPETSVTPEVSATLTPTPEVSVTPEASATPTPEVFAEIREVTTDADGVHISAVCPSDAVIVCAVYRSDGKLIRMESRPAAELTPEPTAEPTVEPTEPAIEPTPDPSVTPEVSVTPDPTVEPALTPTPESEITPEPTPEPTVELTPEPSATLEPTVEPTSEPAAEITESETGEEEFSVEEREFSFAFEDFMTDSGEYAVVFVLDTDYHPLCVQKRS